MKAVFVEFVRDLRGTVRARRQEKLREIELSWTINELTSFRLFVRGLHISEKTDVCYALADAQAIPLLEILIDFAESDPELRKIAFQSMEKTSTLARIYLAEKLLDSDNPEVRVKTCEMLGNSGEVARHLLEKALGDRSPKVRIAAINGVLRTGLGNSWPKLLPFLESDDKDTRFAALSALGRLGVNSPAMTRELIKILQNRSEDEFARRISAGVLARAGSQEARAILLHALSDHGSEYLLRLAAAESLGAYNDQKAIRSVLCAVYDNDATIARTARLSLSRKHSSEFTGVLAMCLDDNDIRIAELAAELLGGLDISQVEKILKDKMKKGPRLPLMLAVARAMGSAGISGAWDMLIKKFRENRIKDPEFFSTLADVAEETNLSEFASLFDEVEDKGCRAVIMERLAIFAQTASINQKIKDLAVRGLQNKDAVFNLPAAVILSHIPGLEMSLVALVIERFGEHCQDPSVPNAIRALLRNHDGAMAELFYDASPVTIPIVTLAAKEAASLGPHARTLFHKLASWARTQSPGVREALRETANLDPVALVESMANCPDEVFLFEAWSHLPESERFEKLPALEDFFASASAEDCLKTISVLDRLRESWCLKDIVTVVFTTRHEEVKMAAKKLAQALIAASGKAA